ncbi:MAG: glycosyltransferase family 2 protein [Lachnospiraceae bacterium]|nr:glycosyltransferase family 2 protein [Lachnospiraceae bacterium]
MNLKMITPYKIKKGFRYLLHFGPKEFMNHLLDRLEPEEVPYGPWFESHKAAEADLAAQRKKGVPGGPMFSVIVPAYMTPEKYLTRMIESVKAQSYENWELVIADASDKPVQPGAKSVADVVRPFSARDRRIRYEKLAENKDIASNTNAAVALAEGSFLAFLDHDDIIAPDALYHFAAAAADGADMIYSDEDKIRGDEEEHFQPHFKPDFNLDLLRSNNYITHFLAVKKSLAGEEPFDSSMSGAQDYDFIFRMSEKAQKIVHIPRVLYHWRTHEASTADNPLAKQYAYEAGKRAIEGNLERTGTKGEVELLPDFGFYRVHYPVQGKPLVSIIIPNKDQADTLKACMEALEKTHYSYYEVLIVENGSREKKTVDYYKKLKEENPRVRFLRWKKPFNYSGINNYAASKAKGDYLLFMNNDVRVSISSEWLTEMLGVCQRADVGAVGARLYYPNNTIQHAGIVIGIGGVAGAMFVDLPRGRSGYMHKAAIMQDLSAVTAALMLVKRSAFEAVGGFTEELAVAFNDVDFCLKLIRDTGLRIVYDPYVEAYHDESRTRGPEDSPEKVRRFQEEIEYMRVHWLPILKNGDPNYNRNLSLKKWNYSLKA